MTFYLLGVKMGILILKVSLHENSHRFFCSNFLFWHNRIKVRNKTAY